MLYPLYRTLTSTASLPLQALLKKRRQAGKEHPDRWREKMAITDLERPQGHLIWLHAASVGEAQSALILIEKIIAQCPHIHILVTSGTRTSAQMLETRLPERSIHQFAPLDHPAWVNTFLNHWRPELALWLESELWPNILHELKQQNIPTILINARLSPKSYKTWKMISGMAKKVLKAFDLILCQTDEDAAHYKQLGAQKVIVSGNLKYAAAALPHNSQDLKDLQKSLKKRPLWLYSSTHAGEEEIAANLHKNLKEKLPDLLTIIVPRHPERGEDIAAELQQHDLKILLRGAEKKLPSLEHDIYIANTLGELGLFYRLSDIAVIGRSFSTDGGGGHNPIEAAQLNCAVLHGPNVQNLQQIYDEMMHENAVIKCDTAAGLQSEILRLLSDEDDLKLAQTRALDFSNSKGDSLNNIWTALVPYLNVFERAQI